MTRAYQIMPGRCKHKVLIPQAEKEWTEKPDVYIYEMKEDGRRYLLQVRPNGASYNYLTSRRISVVTGEFVEKQDSVPTAKWHKFPDGTLNNWANTVFDGEWCSAKGEDSNQAATAMATGRGYYVVWDLLMFKNRDLRQRPLYQRRELLLKIFPTCPSWMEMVMSDPDPEAIFQIVREEDREGLVRKDLVGSYGEGWTKAKKVEDFDVVIYGYTETDSEDWRSKGWIGAILFGQWERQKTFCKPATDFSAKEIPKPGITRNYNRVTYKFRAAGQCIGITNKLRDKISKNQADFLGKVMEVRSNKRFPDSGMFRHPRFRKLHPDKNAIECLWEI